MERSEGLSVLMLPWLAHGHLSPYLELAKRLSNKNFQIYLCSTPVNLTSISKKLIHGYSIKLIEFEIPSQPDLPPHLHTTNRLPLHLHKRLIEADAMASPTFSNLMKSLKPDILIYDFNKHWSVSVAAELNIPAVQFITGSPIMLCYSFHIMKRPDEDFPYPALNLPGVYWSRKFQDVFKPMKSAGNNSKPLMGKSCGIMFLKSSFEEVDRKYIEYASELFGLKIVPTGPLIQDPEEDEDIDSEIMDWLNKKERSSTVFISFGTESFLSREERDEIAKGLELSMVNFIWALRFPFGEKISIEEALPSGFLERVKIEERGLVIDKWVSQARILTHPNIGGFVSHCGWGSTLEAMAFGVPIVAMPMQLDQPLNARLVTEVGVGVEVERDENGKVSGEEIGRLISDVVVGENGKKIRDKVADLKEKIKIEKEDAIDGVVEELYKLHNQNISGESN